MRWRAMVCAGFPPAACSPDLLSYSERRLEQSKVPPSWLAKTVQTGNLIGCRRDLKVWRSIADTTANLLNRARRRAERLHPPGCTRGCVGSHEFSPPFRAGSVPELNDVERRFSRSHSLYICDQLMELCWSDRMSEIARDRNDSVVASGAPKRRFLWPRSGNPDWNRGDWKAAGLNRAWFTR